MSNVLYIIWACVVLLHISLCAYEDMPKRLFYWRTDRLVKRLVRQYNISNSIVMPRFNDKEIVDVKTGKQLYRFTECGKDGRTRDFYVSKDGKLIKPMSWR